MNKIKNPLNFESSNEVSNYINNLPLDLLIIFNELVLTKTKNFKRFIAILVNKIKQNILLSKKIDKNGYKSLLELTNKYGNTVLYFIDLERKNNNVLHFNTEFKDIDDLRKKTLKNLDSLYDIDEKFNILSTTLFNRIQQLAYVMVNFSNSCYKEIFNKTFNNLKANKLTTALIGSKDKDDNWNILACIDRLKAQLVFNISGDCSEDIAQDIKEIETNNVNPHDELIFEYLLKEGNK